MSKWQPQPDQSRDGRRVVVLHIGAPKTGSSAIQTFLSINREELLNVAGVLYPTYRYDHHARAGRATTGNGFELAKALEQRDQASMSWHLDQIFSQLQECQTLVYSSERFWAVPANALAELSQIRDMGADIKIVFYGRPQVEHMASAYWQAVKNNSARLRFREFVEKRVHLFCFGKRLEEIDGRFGAGTGVFRLYDRDRFEKQDVVRDFLRCLGIADSESFSFSQAEVNPRIRGPEALFGLAANRALGRNNVLNATLAEIGRNEVSSLVYKSVGGGSLYSMLDPADGKLIHDSCRADNCRLAELLGQESNLKLNERNKQMIAKIEGDQPNLRGDISALELLLLHRVFELEREVERLRSGEK